MKNLTTISLIIFGLIIVAVIVWGTMFPKRDNNTNISNNNQTNINSSLNTTKTTSVTLTMPEIIKHNKTTDCWILMNGRVYDITSYFGEHPGGNEVMAATCGTDATNAYMTKDPNATSTGSYSAHSAKALSLLKNYYLGDLNQIVINITN